MSPYRLPLVVVCLCAALASALDYLAADAALRAALGTRARRAVERDFDLHCCTRRLTAVLREAYA